MTRPATPAGWRIVNHDDPAAPDADDLKLKIPALAFDHDVVVYEVSVVVDPDAKRAGRRRSRGPGSMEIVGRNATEFSGFPAGTLEIGRFDVMMFMSDGGMRTRITYQFLYREDGQPRQSLMPSCDFHRLPWGEIE